MLFCLSAAVGFAAAEALLTRRPSLTLLVLSACLFALAALVQRLTRSAPVRKAAGVTAVLEDSRETRA